MKTIVVVVAMLLAQGAAPPLPSMSCEERAAIEVVKCNDDCLGMLQHVVQMERLGGSTGWSEKWNPRLGDRVASGLLRIGNEHSADGAEIRVYLRVMRTAFSHPCYIDDAKSIRPRGTLAFLRWLSTHYPELQSEIRGVIDDLEVAARFDFHNCPPELQEIYPWQKLP